MEQKMNPLDVRMSLRFLTAVGDPNLNVSELCLCLIMTGLFPPSLITPLILYALLFLIAS